jgi:hypothetical protein
VLRIGASICFSLLFRSVDLIRLGHGYGYKWTDPGRTASGYHPEAILLDRYPPLKNGADLGDYDVILAYFRVRFRGEVSIYSSKTRIIFPPSSLIIISSSSSSASNTP